MELTFRAIKNSFFENLCNFYPHEEVEAIFRLCIEAIFKDSYINVSLLNNISEFNAELKKLGEINERLLTNEPIQHILGKAYFFGLEFMVNKDVLIPRQETEILVDLLIKHSKKYNKPKILDVGTGSGCIGISLKKNIPQSNVQAVDVSIKALSIAQRNAELNNADITFIEEDILNWKNYQYATSYDIIVSNPPYVRESEKSKMNKNVKDFDPELALYVTDSDPLIFYREISKFSIEHLDNRGTLAFEINEAFGDETVLLVKKTGFNSVQLIKDLNGKDRIVIAEK